VLPIDVSLYGLAGGWLYSDYDPNLPPLVEVSTLLAPMLVMTPLITANHVLAVVSLARGESTVISRILAMGIRRSVPALTVVGLSTVGILAGLVAFVIPGIYLIVMWFVVVQVVVIEGERNFRALRRSRALVRNSPWRVFSIFLIIAAIALITDQLTQAAVDEWISGVDLGVAQLAGRVIADTIVFSFSALIATLLYFDLYARHERPTEPPPYRSQGPLRA
jgi:hypothetical protein